MKKIKSDKQITILLGYGLLFVVLILYSCHLYYNRGISSGFFFQRLSYLISDLNQNIDIVHSNHPMPFEQTFLASISLITGLDLINSVFLPILPVIGFFSTLLLAKIFFKANALALMASLTVTFSVFAFIPHIVEYAIAQILFLYFSYCFYKYLEFGKTNVIYSLLTIIFFVSIKFFGPPMETWALTLVFFVSLIIIITNRHNLRFSTFSAPLTLLILFSVIMFAYNPKFYHGFLYMDISLKSLFSDIETFISNIFLPTLSQDDFTTSYISALPLRITNLIYTICITLPILIGTCLFVYKSKLNKNQLRDWRYVVSLGLLFPLAIELIVYGSIGALPLRYLYLVFPIISIFWITKLNRTKIALSLICCIFLLSSCSLLFKVSFSEKYPFPKEQSSISLIAHLSAIPNEDLSILADHHTFGALTSYYSNLYKKPVYFKLTTFTSELYSEITNPIDKTIYTFDCFVVNVASNDKPIRQGPPKWISFEPLDKHIGAINKNDSLMKTYDNGMFYIYKP